MKPAALTPRQAELLGLICEGLTNPEIARRLVLELDTVHVHLAGIYSAFGLAGVRMGHHAKRWELRRRAARRGVIVTYRGRAVARWSTV